MHRTEDKEYLLKGGYDKKMNILNSTKPGEIYFLEKDIQPKAIVGSVSALLISLKFIFKDINIVAYKFKNKTFLDNRLISLAYDDMKKSGIKIIDIEKSEKK